MKAEIGNWLKDCFQNHKLRILLGLVFLAVEVYLLLGTGVMGEDVVNFHSGEGSWELQLTAENPGICQEFTPQYNTLQLLSVLAYKENITVQDAGMRIVISDRNNEIVYQKDLDIAQVENGRFTDIQVNLELSAGKTYYLTVLCTPSSKGEYPSIGVCGAEYELPENGEFLHGETLQGVQMVSRYHYVGALTSSKLRNALLVAVVTALGIMFGLPQNKYLRRAAGVVLFLAAPYVLGQRLELLTYNPVFYLPISMKWNLGIMYALEVIVLLVTHSLPLSVVLTNVALTILYSANYFVLMYRGTSLRMNDFAAIGTAADVVADFDLIPDSHLAMAWALLVLIVVYGVQTNTWRITRVSKAAVVQGEKQEASGKRGRLLKVLSYVVTIVIAVAMAGFGGHKLLYTDYLNDVGFADKEYFGINFELIYANNGYLVGTCVEVKNSRIEEPTGYSVEQVEGILTEASTTQEAGGELPHVILIMNESLADIYTVADVELNQDSMPFIRSMQENTLKGYVNASVLGGGTANSEFEVFTGCATAFLPVNYYPYQQAIRRPMSSMVSQMEEHGYTTIAMHPVTSSNWNRKNVYQYLGFDEMLFEEEFEGAEVIHSGVSDAETYKRIIELYEAKSEEEKLFIFDLTMQNHGGYNKDGGPDEVQAPELNNPQIDEYLSAVKVSDEAFADLVSYFEKEDEKVVICMFGDHQPWVFADIEEKYLVEAESVEERTMNNYRTPFVIWANYDIEETDDYDISMNYLGGLLQRTAGIPLSPYFAYLEQLRLEYPVITINGYMDNQGNYYNWDGSGSEFPEYRMLQYHYLFDHDTVEWGY